MKKIELVPFGTTSISEVQEAANYSFITFVCDVELSADYVEHGKKVPAVLLNQRWDGRLGFFGGFAGYTSDISKNLYEYALDVVSKTTNVVVGFSNDKVIPVATHKVYKDGQYQLNHFYYVKLKHSSIKKLMIALIESQSFNVTTNGSILVPVANFKHTKKAGLCNFIDSTTGALNNSADTVSDEFILLSTLLLDMIEDDNIRENVSETIKNANMQAVDTLSDTTAEKKELDLYRIPMTNVQTLEHREPTYRLTPEQAQQIGAVKVFDNNAINISSSAKVYASAETAAVNAAFKAANSATIAAVTGIALSELGNIETVDANTLISSFDNAEEQLEHVTV